MLIVGQVVAAVNVRVIGGIPQLLKTKVGPVVGRADSLMSVLPSSVSLRWALVGVKWCTSLVDIVILVGYAYIELNFRNKINNSFCDLISYLDIFVEGERSISS